MSLRVCTKCRIEKEENRRNFYRISSNSSNFRSVCKSCSTKNGPKRNTPEDILKRYIVDKNGCWIYTGGVNSTGYGVFYMRQASYMAHRVSYELHNGNIENGLVLDHLCRVRNCINPKHLEAVTQAENVKRTWKAPHCSTCKCKVDD